MLEVDAIKIVPKSPYRVGTLDYLQIRVNGSLPDQPINGTYAVEPGGYINLGPSYGRVKVTGSTLDEAAEAIFKELQRTLKQPQVSVVLGGFPAGLQQVGGQHRVGPDGKVNLGVYGMVFVTGLTVEQARAAIEKQLSQFLESPQVSVDVYTYASKYYYIISQGGGLGDRLVRVQITGNETVLDAISATNGLSQVSSKKIWIARPTPTGCDQILPVSYDEITRGSPKRRRTTNFCPAIGSISPEDKFVAIQLMDQQGRVAGGTAVRIHHLGR